MRAEISTVTKATIPVATLPGTNQLYLTIGLPLRNRAELNRLLIELYDPATPRFRQFLSPEEFAARFAPVEKDYQRVANFVRTNGLAVTGLHPNRMLMEVSGVVERVERAFHTRLRVYKHPTQNRTFFAPELEPSVDGDLPISDLGGLDNYHQPLPLLIRQATPSTDIHYLGSGPGGSYRGKDFRAAYLPGVRLSGTGQLAGLLEFDGYFTNDIVQYASDSGITTVALQNVLTSGFNGLPGTNNDEVALDIDMVNCMAPGLSKIVVYEGTSGDVILNRMATDNLAKQLSSSWSFRTTSTTEQIYQQFAAQGQAMFQASGDFGAPPGARQMMNRMRASQPSRPPCRDDR